MNNEVQDKQYIALELTKILFTDKVKYQKEAVYGAYQYFLLNATNVYDTIDTFLFLKNENERLQKENLELKSNNRDDFEKIANKMAEFIEQSRGDMENYVYSGLMNFLSKKIQ